MRRMYHLAAAAPPPPRVDVSVVLLLDQAAGRAGVRRSLLLNQLHLSLSQYGGATPPPPPAAFSPLPAPAALLLPSLFILRISLTLASHDD